MTGGRGLASAASPRATWKLATDWEGAKLRAYTKEMEGCFSLETEPFLGSARSSKDSKNTG